MTTNVAMGDDKPEWKKYKSYALDHDPLQDDKATEIRLCSFARPHMRAFHCSWWSFFIAFFIWFAIGPLLPDISKDLGISKKEIWTSSIAGVGGTIFVRFLIGPLCDKYGARVLFSILLCVSTIPTALTGVIQSAQDLIILRTFIGIAGATFVTCEYWTSRMFAKEVVGTANALVAGWGNLGAGVTNLVIGSFLYPLFKLIHTDEEGESNGAWRTVCVIPAVIGFATGVAVYFISDDCPKGNYSELKQRGVMAEVSLMRSFCVGCTNYNSWILFIQYACCFGVELTMNNAATMYFKDKFGLSTETAAAMASIFGWMNLFARGAGGFMSDIANFKAGMRGRLYLHAFMLLGEGALVLIFANTNSLFASIITLVFFSLFVQAAEGTSYAIVPYVDPPNTGSISGIVGAGGNVGAVVFGLGFREMTYDNAFLLMGLSILVSALLTALIFIRGYAGMLCGDDVAVDSETGALLQKEDGTDSDEDP